MGTAPEQAREHKAAEDKQEDDDDHARIVGARQAGVNGPDGAGLTGSGSHRGTPAGVAAAPRASQTAGAPTPLAAVASRVRRASRPPAAWPSVPVPLCPACCCSEHTREPSARLPRPRPRGRGGLAAWRSCRTNSSGLRVQRPKRHEAFGGLGHRAKSTAAEYLHTAANRDPSVRGGGERGKISRALPGSGTARNRGEKNPRSAGSRRRLSKGGADSLRARRREELAFRRSVPRALEGFEQRLEVRVVLSNGNSQLLHRAGGAAAQRRFDL
jgi:hypothetical protein